MTGRQKMFENLTIPVVCAPMFLVTTVEMVVEACSAGIVGVLPRANFRTAAEFEMAVMAVQESLRLKSQADPGAKIGPLGVNLAAQGPAGEIEETLSICQKHNIRLLITALGDPKAVVLRSREWGALVFHDVTTLKHAEKAIAAEVDGIIAVTWGGGGHSGQVNPFVLIPQIRARFDGTLVLAGGISNGAAIKAAEVLGADLVYMGTRFIATEESGASMDYKTMIVNSSTTDVVYTSTINGMPASWLRKSIESVGIDFGDVSRNLSSAEKVNIPDGVKPWRDIWSGGQGVGLIDDIPSIKDLVRRLCQEYRDADGQRGELTQ